MRSAFERVFATPHGTDLGALCAAHHMAYERVDDLGRLASGTGRASPPASGCSRSRSREPTGGRRRVPARPGPAGRASPGTGRLSGATRNSPSRSHHRDRIAVSSVSSERGPGTGHCDGALGSGRAAPPRRARRCRGPPARRAGAACPRGRCARRSPSACAHRSTGHAHRPSPWTRTGAGDMPSAARMRSAAHGPSVPGITPGMSLDEDPLDLPRPVRRRRNGWPPVGSRCRPRHRFPLSARPLRPRRRRPRAS